MFIAPQFSVPAGNQGGEWSCPDFVALDFERPDKPEVVVVEVATGSNVDPIVKKVQSRQTQWFDRIRAKLTSDGIIDDSWPLRFLGFVRKAKLEAAKRHFCGQPDVAFAAIEDAVFAWDYWTTRTEGLPR